MSNRFAAAVQTPAPGRRPAAATRQGKKHVGAYVDPTIARQLRIIAAAEDSSVAAARRGRDRPGSSVPREVGGPPPAENPRRRSVAPARIDATARGGFTPHPARKTALRQSSRVVFPRGRPSNPTADRSVGQGAGPDRVAPTFRRFAGVRGREPRPSGKLPNPQLPHPHGRHRSAGPRPDLPGRAPGRPGPPAPPIRRGSRWRRPSPRQRAGKVHVAAAPPIRCPSPRSCTRCRRLCTALHGRHPLAVLGPEGRSSEPPRQGEVSVSDAPPSQFGLGLGCARAHWGVPKV